MKETFKGLVFGVTIASEDFKLLNVTLGDDFSGVLCSFFFEDFCFCDLTFFAGVAFGMSSSSLIKSIDAFLLPL